MRVRELDFVGKMRAGVGGRGGESGNERDRVKLRVRVCLIET